MGIKNIVQDIFIEFIYGIWIIYVDDCKVFKYLLVDKYEIK